MQRNAFICTHKACQPPFRVFLAADAETPRCPEHGATMVVQANAPYMQGEKSGKPKRVKPRRPQAKKEETA